MDLYQYSDYRKYLKDYYNSQKTEKASYSYRVFAQRARLTSPNYLKLVIDGKRRITDRLVDPFIRGLGLNPQQSNYFRNLVFYQEARDVEAKRQYLDKLVTIRKRAQSRTEVLRPEQHELLSHWYHWIIRELVILEGFQEDPLWISARLGKKVTPREAQDSLDLLLGFGLLKRDDTGKLVQNEPLLSTGDEISTLLVRHLHRQFIEKGVEALFSLPPEEREIQGVNLALPRAVLPQVKRYIRKFAHELNQKFSAPSEGGVADTVYHLNLNFFPLTQGGTAGEAKEIHDE